MNEAAKRLGVSLRQTEDQLTRDMLAASATFLNCVNGINGDVPTELTLTDIQTVIRTLLGNNAETLMGNIEGELKFNTAPVRWAYIAMMHSNVTSNLESIQQFIPSANYPATMNALPSEWGAVENIRYLVSSIGSVVPNGSALNQNVYNIFVAANESYACIEQDGYSATFVYRPPIYSDPLAQNASVGWKMAQVPRLLNDLWLLNQRCTLS